MSKLYIYDSMQNKKVVFEPLDTQNIRVYACGPTVYDYAHIGNARMAVVFDTLIRLLRYLFPKVTYVSNITDIDDKIIERSNLEKVSTESLTNKFSKIYNRDMKMLNVQEPDYQPKATEYIDEMIQAIAKLEKEKYAYFSDGHVMFNVNSFKSYGALSSRKQQEQIAGSRVKVSSYKKNPEDFVLWKPSKDNEPFWKSPWGRGRPGWHTECFVMATKILGTPFDIHGGGLDLKFPHHENELAQSCCFSGNLDNKKSYAKYWMHNGFVTVDAEKMSKSLGNIKLVKDYLNIYNGEVIRLSLLSAHYRSPLNWSEEVLLQSKNILMKYNKILDALKNLVITKNTKENKIIIEIEKALLDDLNISKAFSILDASVKEINKKNEIEKKYIKEAIEFLGEIVGIFIARDDLASSKNKKNLNLNEINILIKKRNEARKNKDYKLADEMRNKLLTMGVEIEDHPEGTKWKEI